MSKIGNTYTSLHVINKQSNCLLNTSKGVYLSMSKSQHECFVTLGYILFHCMSTYTFKQTHQSSQFVPKCMQTLAMDKFLILLLSAQLLTKVLDFINSYYIYRVIICYLCVLTIVHVKCVFEIIAFLLHRNQPFSSREYFRTVNGRSMPWESLLPLFHREILSIEKLSQLDIYNGNPLERKRNTNRLRA